jgi:hypothetical protein
MNFFNSLHEVKQPGALILTTIFVSVLYINSFLTILGVEFLPNLAENRRLYSISKFFNKYSTKDIKNSCDNFNKYLNDHFAMRKPLVALTNSMKYYLFNSSSDPVAMPAKNGWIYYGTRAMIRDYKRVEHLSNEQIKQIELSLLQKSNWLSRQGIKFMFVIIPNKHNIYPQYMPAGLKKGSGISRGEYLVKHLSNSMPGVTVDAFDVLRKHALRDRVFYRIDTHWNHQGAKIVAEHVIEMISKSNSRLQYRVLPQMKDTTSIFTPGNFGRVMGVPLHEKEVVPVPQNSWGWHAVPADDIRAMLPQRARVSKRLNPHAPKTKVLVLGDSYMARFSDYFSEAFGETVFVNLWDTKLDATNRFPVPLIESMQPDLVVLIFAERRIGNQLTKNKGYYYLIENPPSIRTTLATF